MTDSRNLTILKMNKKKFALLYYSTNTEYQRLKNAARLKRIITFRGTTLKMMTIFGGVTVFGIPIVQSLYGNIGIIYTSIFCVLLQCFDI